MASKTNGGWIDEETPADKRKITSLIDGTEYDLVMSDEFNAPGRTFKDGDDPTWTALDKSDDDSSAAGGGSQHFYNSTAVSTTKDGYLEIRSTIDKTEWKHLDEKDKKYKDVKKDFKSGMLQSWNKFCFTGGILEVDVIFPGDPSIGGLWPAIWLLGNLGRATYEASTNNIWPFSYDKCDRKMQAAQTISACNLQNHFGLNALQGRGATEIDLIEIMAGEDVGFLKGTSPGVGYPYADLTLQVAPGIKDNRPQSGSLPHLNNTVTDSGIIQFLAETWYEGLETNGNTTLNPYFYGTYLGETKPEEPVHRTKKQVFQADAVGAMHQMTPSNFQTFHTFRLEWQPGPGGRLDWFAKDHRINSTYSESGDGRGQDWVRAFTIKDESLNITGAQIPDEPSYLIMNTAISSTWGFPEDYEKTKCETKCYDCNNATCACNFRAGFCNMMKSSRVAMYLDHVRVYQSKNNSAHVGSPHTVGCDPVHHPTKEFILGNEFRYMRDATFGADDKHSLKKKITNGGGKCTDNLDCGGVIKDGRNSTMKSDRGVCEKGVFANGFFNQNLNASRCKCNDGYTGPYCLADDKYDDEMGAWDLKNENTLFEAFTWPTIPMKLVSTIALFFIGTIVVGIMNTSIVAREIEELNDSYKALPQQEHQ